MAQHVFHWKHGWLPLDHVAAVEKGKGKPVPLSGVPRGELRRAPHITAARAKNGRIALLDTKTGHSTGISGAHATSLHDRGHTITAVKDRHLHTVDKHGAPHKYEPTMLTAVGLHDNLRPGVAADLRGGSAEKHLVKDMGGTHFTPERAALHQHIIDTILGDHKRQDHPVYTMLGGGPASGKTKAKDQALSDHPDAVVIDPDAIKKMLPEYAKLPPSEAAQHVHEESSYLSKLVTQAALNRKTHVVVDAVGNNSVKSVTDKIAQAKAAGYKTHGSYVTVPTAIAQERARLRGEKSGRVVPPHVIGALHSGVSDVFPQVMHQFDSAALYDNTAEWKKVLSAHKGQPEVVHELELYRAFLQKKAG